MSRKRSPALPDLDDDDSTFRRKMEPLLDQALPKDRRPGKPDIRSTKLVDYRRADKPENRNAGLVGAAQTVERIETTRGVKKRFEYMIPERVGKALAADAASRGMSATTRLLEVLRDSGYPVIQEDLIDLRKLPKR